MYKELVKGVPEFIFTFLLERNVIIFHLVFIKSTIFNKIL